MLPSKSFRKAPFTPPIATIPVTALSPGMSYSSNSTSLPRSFPTVGSMSPTWDAAAVLYAAYSVATSCAFGFAFSPEQPAL